MLRSPIIPLTTVSNEEIEQTNDIMEKKWFIVYNGDYLSFILVALYGF